VIKKYLLTVLFSTFLWADTIGGEASIGFTSHSIEGSSSYNTLGAVDVVDTLGFSSTQDIFLSASIEHPLPLFPNVKLGYTSFSYDARSLVSSFSWGDIRNFTGKIDNSLSFSYTDATLYYELLDNWTEIDAGFTFRYLKGDMRIASTRSSDAVSYTSLVPMLYGKARFNIPSTDISFQAEMNLMGLSGMTAYDYALSARYSFSMGLGIEAGYKTFHLDSNDLVDGLKTDIDISGPYLSAVWDF
jgi:outer membrane protein